MSTLHRTASIYKDVPGYLETLFSDNQSYTINFFIRAHAIINASNKLQANTTYKSFAKSITPTNPQFGRKEHNMEIYIVRHGETIWNADKRLQGREDIELSEYGRKLAGETGRNLENVHFDRDLQFASYKGV